MAPRTVPFVFVLTLVLLAAPCASTALPWSELTPERLGDLRSPAPEVTIPVTLPDGTQTIALLRRFELFSSGGQMIEQTAAGPVPLATPDVVLRRGSLIGVPDSLVYLAAEPDKVSGFIRLSDTYYEVTPDPTLGTHQLLGLDELPPRPEPGCALELVKDQPFPHVLVEPTTGPGGTDATLEAEIAVDADKNLYDYFGSSNAASNYITSLFGAVSAIYERDIDVVITVVYLRVWTTPDPYTGSNSYDVLIQFRNYWNANMGSVSRDIAHLVTKINFGGIAYLDVLCNNSYGYGVSGIHATYNYPNSNYTWDADVVSHEMGHNFASPHTHCYTPPIDECYNQESGCYSGPVNAQIGTIMSYCHLVQGKTLDFHARVQTVMRNAADSASCIDLYSGGCGTVTVSPSNLPAGTAGTAYNQTLSASGGTPPYTFAVTSGALPPGLSLSSAGVLSGTPTATGSYSFTVTATDSAGCTGSRAYSLSIGCGSVVVSPSNLPAATEGVSYSQTIAATGGLGPYSFAVTSGALPPGLNLSSAGLLSGTPTTAGSYSFTVTATDSAGCTGSRAYSLTVNPPSCGSIVLSPSTLPSGTEGIAYNQTITASGGNPPYTFAVTSGTLPPGLNLSSSGLLSGTPTTAGSYGFTVTATDSAGCTGSSAYSLSINPAGCGSIALSPAALPGGSVGSSYWQLLSASGGAGPYTFDISSGRLPPGLQLSSGGVLSGTPTLRGTFTFVVRATDSAGCVGSASYDLPILELHDYLAGQGHGAPNVNRVRVFDRTGTPTGVDFLAYAAGSWGVNVSSGTVRGSVLSQLLTGPGPGSVFGPQVRGFERDGTGMGKVNFFAYGTLKYGVNVGAADLDGDGFAEVTTGAGPGSVFGPHVRGWNFDGQAIASMGKINFFAYGTLKYGVNVSSGGIDGDVYPEILTGPGPGIIFGPQIRGWDFDAASISPIAGINFNAFPTPNYGVHLASGEVDDDAFDEILATPGPGPNASFPARFRGFDFDGSNLAGLAGFDETPFGTIYGGRVGVGNVGSTAAQDLLAAPGPDPSASSEILPMAYLGRSLVPVMPSFETFRGSNYGVNVNGALLGY